MRRCWRAASRRSEDVECRRSAVYEATRKPRASAVQTGSSANTWMRNETNPDWVYGYDAWTAPLVMPVAA